MIQTRGTGGRAFVYPGLSIWAALGCAPDPHVPGPAPGEFPVAFGAIASIRELASGYLLVIDARSGQVGLLDSSGTVLTTVGSRGSGDGQYAGPRLLLSMSPDSTLLVDVQLQRLLPIGPDGTVGESTFDAATWPGLWASGAFPKGMDADYLYLNGPDLVRGPEGPRALDSTPLLRLDRRTARLDTLGWIQLAKPAVYRRQGADPGEVFFIVQPLQTVDEWAVGQGGRVAIARGSPYRMEWLQPPEASVKGPTVQFHTIKVRDADRRSGGGGRREWPATKPAFGYLGSGEFSAVSVAPDGTVWVRRLTDAKEPREHHDLFGGGGGLLGQVVLPPGRALRGFGRGVIYTVRRDAVGAEYLSRSPLPLLR